MTAKKWLSILRAGYIVELIQPHHENFSKRLVKSPKLYFVDTGLLCHLLGIREAGDLRFHPLRGAIFENFIVTEFRKLFMHQAQRPPLYFWRDSHGHELDLIIDLGKKRIPVEIKSGRTIASDFFKELDFYCSLSKEEGGILVTGSNESYTRKGHRIFGWFNCS